MLLLVKWSLDHTTKYACFLLNSTYARLSLTSSGDKNTNVLYTTRMRTNNKHPFFAGIFFLISDITSIIALVLYQPLLKHSDFITNPAASNSPILWGAFLEILLALSVTGTAIALYPSLKKRHEALSIAYVIGRALEATIILLGVLSLLSVTTLKNTGLVSINNTNALHSITSFAIALHDWTFLIGPNIILSVNAFILGCILYRTKQIPRFIALLALIDGPILFVSGIAILFGAYSQTSTFAGILALPMLIFEVSFAVWLMTRGDLLLKNQEQ